MCADRPGIPALYMSGYSRDVINEHGTLADGEPFLQKPFPPEILLRRVRELLDARRSR
jgi:CheY-like chemotaxis protein